MTSGARERRALPALAAAGLAALALTGCGGSDGSDGSDGVATTPGGTTATTPGQARRWSPPPLRIDPGGGRAIGAEVRLQYAALAPSLPSGFVPGGVTVGTRSGDCVVPEPTAELRAQLLATAQRQTPTGTVLPIDDDHILLADCGTDGIWAFAAWVERRPDGQDRVWIDELRSDGGGRWTGTARGVQPGCRMPPQAAAAWQIDVTACPQRPPTPPPTTTTPPPSTTPPPPSTAPDPTPRIPAPDGEDHDLPPGGARA